MLIWLNNVLSTAKIKKIRLCQREIYKPSYVYTVNETSPKLTICNNKMRYTLSWQ